MVTRTRLLGLVAVVSATIACGSEGPFRQLVREQRLPSGKIVKIISCQLAWGVEHDERFPERDGFSLEYLAVAPRVPAQELEREVLDVFELIRPLSEAWGLSSASISALRTAERTGTYDVFGFTRTADGAWSHTSLPITRNPE
jgi:hypothetical protein